MSKFITPQWESDHVGDAICSQLFKTKEKSRKQKKKNKVIASKIEKRKASKGDRKKPLKAHREINLLDTDLVNRDTFKGLKSNQKAHKIKTQKGPAFGNKKSIKQGLQVNARVKQTNKTPPKNPNVGENNKGVHKESKAKKQEFKVQQNPAREVDFPDPEYKAADLQTPQAKKKPKNKSTLLRSVGKHLPNINFKEGISKNILTPSTENKKLKHVGSSKSEPVPSKVKEKINKIGLENILDKNVKEHLSKRQKKREKVKKKLAQLLSEDTKQVSASKMSRTPTLRHRMLEKLKAARFRYLNEQMYSTESKEAQKLFHSDPDSFSAYHEGYRQQVTKWPLNPLDVIIKKIRKLPTSYVIADMGCGDAALAKSVEQQVHSFDLVAANESVVACDMARVPLPNESVDVVVFCLSLMGTNLRDYLREANRILKTGGVMKIAEVESRFDDVDNFIKGVEHFGFKKIWKDLSHNLFYFLYFNKLSNLKNKKKLPTVSLKPCLYKKR